MEEAKSKNSFFVLSEGDADDADSSNEAAEGPQRSKTPSPTRKPKPRKTSQKGQAEPERDAAWDFNEAFQETNFAKVYELEDLARSVEVLESHLYELETKLGFADAELKVIDLRRKAEEQAEKEKKHEVEELKVVLGDLKHQVEAEAKKNKKKLKN